jgi:hypothetical protein
MGEFRKDQWMLNLDKEVTVKLNTGAFVLFLFLTLAVCGIAQDVDRIADTLVGKDGIERLKERIHEVNSK